MLEELTQKIQEAISKKAAFGFNVRFDLDDDESIYVQATSEPVKVSSAKDPADTVFKVSKSNLEAMLDGKLSPMSAYITGKMKIEGDMTKAMQLSSLFG
ncbi:SCP2 sterol-binding domain-containing protein [Woeseiaceae bacterium]|jgi:putative sterol carrier protein|nr:SCP2 sterol-binding domain-containing protein [Woeseiaceae bacterium]|tara:strand:+ start:93 stop:389 length:297 start_codon:yes stop_codon:yes gene_type:complete